MRISQYAVQTINGKVIYLFKIADQLNSKMNLLGKNLKKGDQTFSEWQEQLKIFSNSASCSESMIMEFLSKYTAEVNRAFTAFLRLFEVQDTLSQISRLNGKTLVGYSDLPKFVSSQLSSKLLVDSSLALTVSALEQGLSVLASPMVDVEHDTRDLNINILFLAPEIANKSNFCVVEHLTPLKFNISGTCFTGPVRQTNLALITCPDSKQIVSVESLDRCFSSDLGFLCPTNVLKTVTDLQWLGFAWNPELKLSFPRNHLTAPNCDHLQPLVHIGGRSFLSTTSGAISTNNGRMDVTPLAIYNFPCNVSFVGMKTSLATCPESLSVSLPLFSAQSIMYVRWDPDSGDILPLQLHHESLAVPPSVVINHTLINVLDELYQYYDSQLTATLDKADSMIDKIEDTTESTLTEYLAYASCGLSVFNLILFCIVSRCIYSIIGRRLKSKSPLTPESSSTIVCTPSQPRKVCGQCAKPVRRARKVPTARKEPQP